MSTSLFGAPRGGTSLFGSNTATTTTSSPFGQSTTNTASNTNTGGLFGQPANQQQQQQQQQNQNNQQSTPFGGSLFAQSQPQQQQQQQQPQQQANPAASTFLSASQAAAPQRASLIWEPGRESSHNQKPTTEQIEGIWNKWNPSNPNTVFKYYFYNKVDQSRVPFYQPSPGEDPREWEQAVHDKPAPGYMPALATGFKAIADRLLTQKTILAQYNQALHQINTQLDQILSQHDLQTSVRALNARRKHAILRQRCLALASRVQVLRNRGYALDKEEDELKTKLDSLDRHMSDPALSARTEELWSRLILLRGYADSLRNEINNRGAEAQEGLGEEVEAKAKKILEDYDKQLQTLKTQVETIKKDYEEWEADRNPPTK
ncbi:hypothetical protein DL769_005606 [Monosporascus sp. CRB-8-3]|nr:hypothetical protein DL769_005606 [Monosporascus sp. CRB-8-3]